MDQPTKNRLKPKTKKAATPKTKAVKKKKCEGGTCSMFLAEMTKKLQLKKMKEEEAKIPLDIIQSIIKRISSALPVNVSKKIVIERSKTLPQIESLQNLAPELMSQDLIEVPLPPLTEVIVIEDEPKEEIFASKTGYNIPKMPLVSSTDMIQKKDKVSMHEMGINTGNDNDVASEIRKHVGTLRKISLIAEEFSQKTAKNLKEIVDSVQQDLIDKLEKIQSEEKAKEQKYREQMLMEEMEEAL